MNNNKGSALCYNLSACIERVVITFYSGVLIVKRSHKTANIK